MKLFEIQSKSVKPTKEEREAIKNNAIDSIYALIKQIHDCTDKKEFEQLKSNVEHHEEHKDAYRALTNAIHQKERMM